MIKRALVVMLTVVCMALAGCATQSTVDMADSYNTAYRTHQIQEANKVLNKAQMIAEVMKFDCEDGTEACGVAKAMSSVIAADRIASIESAPFELEKHKTDMDVQSQVLTTIGKGIPFVTMGVVSYKSIAEDRGTTTNVAGGDISTNYDEDHATAIGDKSNSSNAPTNEEVVFMPEEEVLEESLETVEE